MNQATHCKIPAHSLLTLDIESLAVVPMLSCVTGYPSLHLNTFFLTNLGTLKNEGVLDFLVTHCVIIDGATHSILGNSPQCPRQLQ